MNPTGRENRQAAEDQSAISLPPSSPAVGRHLLPGRGGRGEGEAVARPSIPDHELLRCIGRGSYGEVWLARNKLGTLRAVKVVHRAAFEDARPFEREFKGIQRFEPISRSHEGLVDILQVGGTEEYFYYVMELADPAEPRVSSSEFRVLSSAMAAAGDQRETQNSEPETYSPHTLRSELKRHGRLPLDRCLEIGRALAGALAHLHARGLVHRDVKPSNVIFVGGVAKLADIGLVAAVSDSRSYVGTEGYIPPEGPGAPSADCYALGKLLYELSTGHDRTAWPDPAPDLPTRPDRERLLELNAILHKACAPDPRVRYRDAEQMQAELAMLQRGQSVKRQHGRERQFLIAKRILAAAAVLVLVSVAVTMLWQGVRRTDTVMSSLTDQGRLASHRRSPNAEANMLVEQGYSIVNSDTPERLRQAASCFTNAIRLDPTFARAYAGLVQVYINDRSTDQMERLRSTARKLLELDDTLPEAHYSQSYVEFSSWEFEAALKSVRHALKLDPNCAYAHFFLGFYLTHLGQAEEGRREYAWAVELEPANPRAVRHLGHPSYALRSFDEARAQYQKALDLEPRHTLTQQWIGLCYQAQKEFLKAIDHFEKYALGRGAAPDKTQACFDQLRAAYRADGEGGYWVKQRELAEQDSSTSPYDMARILSHLGPADEVFAWLDKAYEKRERDTLEYLLFDECWDPYRSDPRFKALLKRVGFPK